MCLWYMSPHSSVDSSAGAFRLDKMQQDTTYTSTNYIILLIHHPDNIAVIISLCHVFVSDLITASAACGFRRLIMFLIVSAFEKRSPGRQMRPINAPGDPEPHHRWSGWRLVSSPKFGCWHSSSIVFKLFIGCPNQNYHKIMYTHYLSSWIYKYK